LFFCWRTGQRVGPSSSSNISSFWAQSTHHNNHHHNNPVIPILLGPILNPATVQEDFIPTPTAPAAAARGWRSPHKFTR
jgi:hypothetical protein